ncbi:MAG TPA: VOC family protein [Ilumatobacteraceae bacterium]
MNDHRRLTALQFQQSQGVEDWRVLAFGANAWFATSSHAAGAELARRALTIGAAAEHLPEVDVRATGVHVRTRSADVSGLTDDDVDVARRVSIAARELGLVADPSVLQTVQLTVDTQKKGSVLGFWRAALAYDEVGDDLLVDPSRRDPSIWFQDIDVDRPLRNRLHLDVGVPPESAHERVAAIEATGGRVVRSSSYHAAIADVDGNEIDVVPLQPDGDLTDSPERADWRVLFSAMVHYPTDDPATAADLAAAAAAVADDAGVEVLIDLRPSGVTVDSGKDRWEDERFAAVAAGVQAAARNLALRADATPLRFVQVGIDAVDVPAVRSFWSAVLGYELDARPGITDIFDPRQLSVPLFFQPMSADETERRAQRNRTHIDVFVPDDQAQARVAAALAAGGRVVYDAEAPEWWTIADPEGNEVDIAVAVGREELAAAREQS